MIRRFWWAGILVLTIVGTGPVQAQTQLELTMQARAAADAADNRLNQTYRKLMTRLDNEAKAKLVKAEMAWIAFRDGQCAFEADWYRGGSASPYQYNLCLQRLTEARIRELQAAIAAYGH